jgi:GDP-L-fucose synthase
LYGPHDNFDLENSHVLPALIRKYHLAKLAVEQNWAEIEKDEAVFGSIPKQLRDRLAACCHVGRRQEIHNAAVVDLWGSGSPRREFLHVDDLASACLSVMGLSKEQYRGLCTLKPGQPASDSEKGEHEPPPTVSHVNVGTGKDVTVKDLATIIKSIVGFPGEETWDHSKPDGTPRKLLNIYRLQRTGWKPRIELKDGIRSTYEWYGDQTR